MKSTFSIIYYLKRQVVKKDGTVPVMGRRLSIEKSVSAAPSALRIRLCGRKPACRLPRHPPWSGRMRKYLGIIPPVQHHLVAEKADRRLSQQHLFQLGRFPLQVCLACHFCSGGLGAANVGRVLVRQSGGEDVDRYTACDGTNADVDCHSASAAK